MSTEQRKAEVAPQPQQEGARRNYTTEKEKTHTQSCATVGVAIIPRTPSTPRGGGRQDEKTQEPPQAQLNQARNTPKLSPKSQKPCLVPQQSGLITQTSPGTERGGSEGRNKKEHPKP